jgi:NADH dehydrogenase
MHRDEPALSFAQAQRDERAQHKEQTMTKDKDISGASTPKGERNRKPKVVIVGGGFAGIHAAKALANSPVDVTLIDRRNHHTFQPLLYQVALAVLTTSDIASPIRTVLRHARNVDVVMDEVVGFDTQTRQVTLDRGAHLNYDYLIVATGATHSYFGHDEWEQRAPGLKTIDDALEIRRRVLLAFELAERDSLEIGTHPALNFAVIGAGPTGVELAGAIAEMSRLFLTHDFRRIDPRTAHTMLIEAGPRVLPAYPEELAQKAVEQLQRLGVEVMTCQGRNESFPPRRSKRGPLRGREAPPAGRSCSFVREESRRWESGKPALGFPLFHPPSSPELWECGNLAVFWRDFQGLVGRVGSLPLAFHAFHSPGISTALFFFWLRLRVYLSSGLRACGWLLRAGVFLLLAVL